MSKLGYGTFIAEPDAIMAAYMDNYGFTERRNHENHINGASSSSSSSCPLNIDLNEIPLDSFGEEPQRICWSVSLYRIPYNIPTNQTTPVVPESSTSKEKRPLLVQEISSKKRAKTNHDASSSSSSYCCMINIDLNDLPPPDDSVSELPPPDDYVSEVPESSKSRRKKKAKKARPKDAKEVNAINSSPPVWLVQVMGNINGAEEPRLIFMKTLELTDVEAAKSRLLIPFNQLIRNDILTPEESKYLEGQGGDKEGTKPGIGVIGVIIVNEKSQKWGMVLKIWYMNNNGNYVLNGDWNEFVSANGLKIDDEISLWSFRWKGTLCFAFLKTTPTVA